VQWAGRVGFELAAQVRHVHPQAPGFPEVRGLGVWLALAGALALLAGLSGRHRVRRLRRHGLTTWGVTVAPPDEAEGQPDGPRRTLVQYRLADGHVLERIVPAAGLRKAPLPPGQKVLVWYDAHDPGDILVYGRWGRASDWAFVAAGAMSVLAGLIIAAHP
jgi:hypothetical protein